MSWKIEVTPSSNLEQPKDGNTPAKASYPVSPSQRISALQDTLKTQLRTETAELAWWNEKTGNKADLIKAILREGTRYRKQELDTLSAVSNIKE